MDTPQELSQPRDQQLNAKLTSSSEQEKRNGEMAAPQELPENDQMEIDDPLSAPGLPMDDDLREECTQNNGASLSFEMFVPYESTYYSPMIPLSNRTMAFDIGAFQRRQISISDLTKLLAAYGTEEANRVQPRAGRASTSAKSTWAPEHLVPVLPPPSASALNDHTVGRLFWNHVRTHSQHWVLANAPPTAKSGDPIYGADAAGHGFAGRAINNPGWTDSENQILFDATLREDGWPGLSRLMIISPRQPEEINIQIDALRDVRLPMLWSHTHEQAQKFLRNRLHHGETRLTEEEWKELAVWVYNGCEGINPSVFHWNRCTERLRKEVRVLDDLDPRAIVRMGAYFAEERSRLPQPTQVGVFKHKGRQ